MSRIAAFFDIDGTIYREGLITDATYYFKWGKQKILLYLN